MEVIGAGLNRTGTNSLNKALRILGYDSYHFEEHVQKHLTFWEEVYSGKIDYPDFATEYAGVQAITDLPAAYFFEEFYKAFPEAKVILTVRDNAEKWYKSYLKHNQDTTGFEGLILKFFAPFFFRVVIFANRYMRRVIYGGILSAGIAKRTYVRHNELVKTVIPADKLLVFNVKEGWEPLCKFLGKDIPPEPFPFKNQTGTVGSVMRQLNRGAYIKAGGFFGILTCFASFMVWKLLK